MDLPGRVRHDGPMSATARRTTSHRGPRGLLGRAGRARRLDPPSPRRVLDDERPPFYRWFPDATLNTCYNALDRHVVDGPRRPDGAHLRQPGHRDASSGPPTPSCSSRSPPSPARCGASGVEQGRPGRHLHADDPRGRRRDARLRAASAPCTRSSSAGSRRTSCHPHRRRQAEGRRRRVLRHRADPGGRVQAAAGPGAGARRARSRTPWSSSSGRRPRRTMHEGRDIDWDVAMRAGPDRPRRAASRSPPPTRSTSSTPRAPPASPRASSATTAGTRSRWPGRCRTSTTCTPGEVWWAASDVGWVVGHSYIVYAPLICGATTVLYEGKPVGTPDAGAFWRVVAEHGVKALFTAPTAIRAIKKEDPDGQAARRARHLLAARRSSWPASGSTPTPTRGPREKLGRPGGRQLVADRDRLADRGQPARARADADQARLAVRARCPGTTSRCSTRPARRSPPGDGGRDLPQAAAARRARCRRCGATTSATSRRTSPPSRATTSPATAATSTRTATSTSWAAPTT